MTHLKVMVRVRPLSQREALNGSISVIEVQEQNTISITNIKVPEQNAGDSRERTRRFTFDRCFDENSTQDDVFSKVESVIGNAIKRRYHSCVLAYGQSSTGKTHTMMGFPHDPGLTPRLCNGVFNYLQETALSNEVENMKIKISYLEIYNEKVRDLLSYDKNGPDNGKKLKVREHPKQGPYVQGLSEKHIANPADLLHWLKLGNENRKVAPTLNNQHSSRSHSVVTISCDGVKLHLVDLAGSEKAGNKFYATSRFREGANINKSLVALGNVISALADQPIKRKLQRKKFVPYRDSVLTWLLKDTLSGNSNTVMIATVSPSSECYNETVNTLRFGQRAKLIVSCPVVNEDPKEKIIRELRVEIAKLRELLKLSQEFPQGENLMSPKNLEGFENNNLDLFTLKNSSDVENRQEEVSPIDKETSLSDLNTSLETLSSEKSSLILSEKESTSNPSHSLNVLFSKPSSNNKVILIPVMNVKTSVSADKKQIPKVRRTFSIDQMTNKVPPRKSTEPKYGSEETISNTKDSINPKNGASSMLRRKSSEKSSSLSSLKSSLLRRRLTLSDTTKKSEKSVETDQKTLLKVTSRVDSHRKPVERSQIVANVTKRLYAKAKQKEAGTDMEGFLELNAEVAPKELSICSNARQRLKELTQKALRAHKFKNVEIQTMSSPVLRVKETSTDCNDIKYFIPEVIDAETWTEISTSDVSVECFDLDSFSNLDDSQKRLKITKSVATQCTEGENLSRNSISSQNSNEERAAPKKPLQRISFAKYLQPQNLELASSMSTNPIYANSVNININHHYLGERRIASYNDDSLEEHQQQTFQTPDLISNHNSLEPTLHGQAQNIPNEELVLRYANVENLQPLSFQLNEEFLSDLPKFQTANIFHIAKCGESIDKINPPLVVYAAVRYISNDSLSERCLPMPQQIIQYARCNIIESKTDICYEALVISTPNILVATVSKLSNYNNQDSRRDAKTISSSEDLDIEENYRKNKCLKKKTNKNDIFGAMSKFLDEATTLMTNISSIATKLNNNIADLQDTENETSNIKSKIKRKRKSRSMSKEKFNSSNVQNESPLLWNNSAQTDPSTSNIATQCFEEFSIPDNKFESMVEESCKRLEEKLCSYRKRRPRSESSRHFDQMDSHSGLSNYNVDFSDLNEDSSLESGPFSFSDYGSLPRRFSRSKNCYPSAFLKQLTRMRRDVIESSRENIQNS